MRKYIFGLILSILLSMFFLTATPSSAALPIAVSLEAGQIQESPTSEQTSEQDTEPQPEPGPSRGGRLLPVRK